MLFRKRKEENLLRQSLLNRFKTRFSKEDCVPNEKQKVHKCTSELAEFGERRRAWSLPSEPELKKYLGPVDERLVENAEIAKRKRRTDERRRYSVQLSSSTDLSNHDGKMRSKTMSLPRHFPSKQTPYNFVRCKLCEGIEIPPRASAEQNGYESDDETYIDENGIYTTVLCLSEI